MAAGKNIRVLIVDDSRMFREYIERGIAQDKVLEVVGGAADPYEASQKIVELKPDVMVLDVEMPKMNGIAFLKKLLPQYPLPTVVISASPEYILDALDAGAVDFVAKPNASAKNKLDTFINELIVKIKIASIAKVGKLQCSGQCEKKIKRNPDSNFVIAIGASTGGIEAIQTILQKLPENMPPIMVVLHMPSVFTARYAQRIDSLCALRVKEAEDGEKLLPGTVYIAPGERHMTLQYTKNGYYVQCFPGQKVFGHCPSVNVLFQSVAIAAGKNALGIILTGMGSDGAEGLLSMRQKGAFTLGQDKKSSIIYGMPMAAYQKGAVMKQVNLKDMPLEIIKALECSLSNQ